MDQDSVIGIGAIVGGILTMIFHQRLGRRAFDVWKKSRDVTLPSNDTVYRVGYFLFGIGLVLWGVLVALHVGPVKWHK